MPVNLSIKNVPDDWADRLRRRAEKSHRSMQGELMAILEAALNEDRPLRPQDLLDRLADLKLKTKDEAAADLRLDRDRH